MPKPNPQDNAKANNSYSLLLKGSSSFPDPFASKRQATDTLGPYKGDYLSQEQKGYSFGFLWRFKKTVIIAFFLISSLSITLIWCLTIPVYRVEAQVRVRPLIPRLVFQTEDNGQIPFYQSYLNTQVSVMLSPTVIQRALDQTDVQKSQWYRKKEFTLMGNPPTPFDRLRKSLSVSPRGMTEIIDISMTDPNPAEAALIINAVLDQYLKYVRESTTQVDDYLSQKLMEEYTSLRGEIEGRESVAAKLRKELGTTIPEGLVSQQKLRIDQLEGRLKELRREIGTYEWQLKELEEAVQKESAKRKKPVNNDDLKYQDDPEWKRLSMEVDNLEQLVEIQSDKLGETHPGMVELRRRLKNSKENLQKRKAELDNEFRMSGGMLGEGANGKKGLGISDVSTLENRIKLLKYQEQLLLSDIKEQTKNFDKMFDLSQTLNRESELINYKRDLYSTLRNRIDQKDIERNVPGSIEVLARAYPPSEPHHDRRILLTLLSLFGGLGVGVGLAYVRASINPRVTEAQEIPQIVHTPFLGQIPLLRNASSMDEEEAAIHSECVRMIRTSLLERIDGQRGSTIMITSAGPRAGKTTVAVMLARSLTKCGKRVLLVDADFRNASVCERMGIEDSPGLLALLTSSADESRVIMGTDMPGLNVLPAGTGWEVTDYERLANGAFSGCLNRWRNRYDLILIDTPPILPVADARIISRQMDGAVMVIREDHCRRTEILEAMAYLGTSGGKLMGTIFIGSANSGSYKRGYYGHYSNSSGSSKSIVKST